MKKILPLVLLLCFISTGMTWPFGKKEPKPKAVSSAVVKSTKPATVSDGREIVKQIAAELKAAKEENSKLKNSLNKALSEVKTAESQTVEVQKSADALREWGIIQQAEAQKFMEKYNNAVKRYHRLKAIAAVIAAAVGVMLGLQFMALVPPPYNLGIPVGGAALFASLVWFFL